MSAKHAAMVVLTALVLHGCGDSEGDASVSAETLTRAQRDSIAATLPIPGAQGVGAALRARDAANARTLAHDSIGN